MDSPLILSIGQFVTAAIIIVVAGTQLVRSTDKISEISRVGRLFAGTLFLAGATSLPELLVDISAVRAGAPDLAVGDLLGSSLMNLLILAVADLLHRNPQKMFSRAGAQHALSAAVSINMTVITCIAIFLGPQLADARIGELGLGTAVIGVAYVLAVRLVYYDQRSVLATGSETGERRPSRTGLARAISVYAASALAIFLAAPYLSESAGVIARETGLGQTFIGTTLLAFCTSLPEIVSTAAALRMGAFDLAVGNIFGSNAFNMVILIPLDMIHPGNLLGAVSRLHIFTGLAVIFATSVVVMGQLYQVERRRKFFEPDAFVVIAIVVAALWALSIVGPSA